MPSWRGALYPGSALFFVWLIGIPVRLTISRRTMERGSLEIKPRWSDEAHMVPEAEVEAAIRKALDSS